MKTETPSRHDATTHDTPLTIGGRAFQSRLMVGTGKYPDNDTMVRAIDASGAEIVTVAVRRVDLDRFTIWTRSASSCSPTQPGATPPPMRCGTLAWRAKRASTIS